MLKLIFALFSLLFLVGEMIAQNAGSTAFQALKVLRGRDPFTAAEMGKLEEIAQPGVHFPNITVLPDNFLFSCDQVNQPGYYADIDFGCTVYHRCENGLPVYHYLCPIGKLFNQITLNCDYWYNIKCEISKQFYDYSNPRLYLGPNVTFLDSDSSFKFKPRQLSIPFAADNQIVPSAPVVPLNTASFGFKPESLLQKGSSQQVPRLTLGSKGRLRNDRPLAQTSQVPQFNSEQQTSNQQSTNFATQWNSNGNQEVTNEQQRQSDFSMKFASNSPTPLPALQFGFIPGTTVPPTTTLSSVFQSNSPWQVPNNNVPKQQNNNWFKPASQNTQASWMTDLASRSSNIATSELNSGSFMKAPSWPWQSSITTTSAPVATMESGWNSVWNVKMEEAAATIPPPTTNFWSAPASRSTTTMSPWSWGSSQEAENENSNWNFGQDTTFKKLGSSGQEQGSFGSDTAQQASNPFGSELSSSSDNSRDGSSQSPEQRHAFGYWMLPSDSYYQNRVPNVEATTMPPVPAYENYAEPDDQTQQRPISDSRLQALSFKNSWRASDHGFGSQTFGFK